MSLEQFCHFALEIEPVFSLQVTSSKIDAGPYKIVVVALSEGGGEGDTYACRVLILHTVGHQTSSLQFRVLNMSVLIFIAYQCYAKGDKED